MEEAGARSQCNCAEGKVEVWGLNSVSIVLADCEKLHYSCFDWWFSNYYHRDLHPKRP